MTNTREIKRRIKSVNSTKKITRAMEMVSASKMRKAIEAVLKTRTYANLSWETVLHLSRTGTNGEVLHPLLHKRPIIKKTAVILITSNRGLCGGFNLAVINKAHQSLRQSESIGGVKVDNEFILLGKKGVTVYKYYGYNISADFPKLDLISEVKEAIPVAKMVIKDYLDGKYDKVLVAYTDYISAMKQVPRVKQLLPIDIKAQDEYLGICGEDDKIGTNIGYIEKKSEKHLIDKEFKYEYIFEPSPSEVLDEMIPRLIEVQLYQAMLESNAAEHSARMNAMHQATDAAGDMINELTLFYNKARQASITSEIAEISAGANALAE